MSDTVELKSVNTEIRNESEKKDNYLTSLPGGVRIITICLGLFSIILTCIGFQNDILESEDAWLAYVSYYGLGYKAENMNWWNLAILCTCCAISIVFMLTLLYVEDAQYKFKAWNRFLHISLANLSFLGWLCGFMGFLLFRQGCCRVEILSSERIKYEIEGYTEPCLCLVNPSSDPKQSYPILRYEDVIPEVEFVMARPHHFNGRVVCIALEFLNVLMYIAASIKC